MFYGGVGDIILIIDEVEQDFIFATRCANIFRRFEMSVTMTERRDEELVHHNIESKYSKMCSALIQATHPYTKDQNALLISFHVQASSRHHCCVTHNVEHSA